MFRKSNKVIPKKMGVYIIKNKMSNKVYVGSTYNFKKRYNEHFKDLIANRHDNQHLQNAVNKYGIDNFIFEIIEYVDDKSALLEREQHYINTLNAVNEGYNICPIAGSPRGRKVSEETRNKLSIASKGKLVGDKNPMYGRCGELHPLYGVPCSEERKRKISQANKGKTSYWKGKHLPEHVKQKLRDNHKGMYEGDKNPMYGKCGALHPTSKQVKCVETQTIYGSMAEAGRLLNICPHNISQCCNGKRQTAGGFHWEKC